MISIQGYIIGCIGVWQVTDGIISIRLYLKAMDETGKRMQDWRYDHSIRVLRSLMGIALIILGVTV